MPPDIPPSDETNRPSEATMRTCTCQILDAPELDGEFGPGVTVQVIKINPDCPAHTRPPSQRATPDD